VQGAGQRSSGVLRLRPERAEPCAQRHVRARCVDEPALLARELLGERWWRQFEAVHEQEGAAGGHDQPPVGGHHELGPHVVVGEAARTDRRQRRTRRAGDGEQGGKTYDAAMSGGIALRGNLLAVTWSASRGHVFLFDVEARQRVSTWTLPAGASGYSDAAGVAMDDTYHLFVADPQNDRVLHYSPFGRRLATYGERAPDVGDAGRDRPGVLDRPYAVAVRGDLVYVAGGDQPRRRGVQRFSRAGSVLKPLAARGDPDARFGAPRGLAADAAGLLVADTLRGVLLRYRGDGTFLRELPCGPPGTLARPIAVLPWRSGACLFVDRGDAAGLRACDASGGPLVLPPDVGRCDKPQALAADRSGRVYVLDRNGERVLRFTPELHFDQELLDLGEWFDGADHDAAPGS